MKTFKQYIKEAERHRLDTVMDTNIKNRIAGIDRSVSFDAGDPSKLNFPKNTVGQLVEPAKPKLKSIPSNMGVGRSDTPVGSVSKVKTNTIPSGTGVGRSDTPVGSMPKAKINTIPSGTGVGRSGTPVGSMPKAKTKDYSGMEDTLGKLKKDAEQTWNIKAREPKDSGFSKMYAGGSVEDRIDISSPKETMKSYIKRRKSDTNKWYTPDKTKDIDLIAARGYDVGKDPKTGILDIKREKDPRYYGSLDRETGRIKVRKHPFRGKTTTTHETGHRGSIHYNPNIDRETEEMRVREMEGRKNTAATSDAKAWWDHLYKGETDWGMKKLSAPLGDRDRISIERLNDRLIDKSRKDLSQKYFRGGRESHTDTDLKKAALGNIYPYGNKEFDKPADLKTGNPNQLNFPKTSAAMRKADAIKRQKDFADKGHFSTTLKVFKRNSRIRYVNKDNSKLRFPDSETGNPNQLNFPKGKK